MTRRRSSAAYLCALTAVLLLPAAPAAGAAALPAERGTTIMGDIEGISGWRGHFAATARGVRGDTTEIVGSKAITRPKYRLSMPAGVYSIVTAVTDRRKRVHYEGRSKLRRFDRGSRKRVDVVVRKKRARSSRDVGARGVAAQAAPPGSIVGVTEFRLDGIRMDEFLIHELFGQSCANGRLKIVEMRHRAELIAEIERSNGKFYDPSTKLQRGKLIKPQTLIRGNGTLSGGKATITVRLTKAGNGGKAGTVTVAGPVSTLDQLASLVEKAAEKIAERLCTLPTRFEGTWTTVHTDTSRGTWKVTVTGSAKFVRTTPAGAYFGPNGYALVSSTVSWTVSGSQSYPDGGCTTYFSGSGTDSPPNEPPTTLSLEDVSEHPEAPDPEPKPFYYSIWVWGDESGRPEYDIRCGEASDKDLVPLPYLYAGSRAWASGTPPDLRKTDDPLLLEGRRVRTEMGYTTDSTWKFAGSY